MCTLRQAQEIASLRASGGASIKAQMYDAEGNIVGAMNNAGEHDSHNDHMDVSPGGMMRKKSLELQAIRSGTVDHKATVAPRKLTEDETSRLRLELRSKLSVPNDNYEEDASDLLDYALDMVAEGHNVGYVVKEVSPFQSCLAAASCACTLIIFSTVVSVQNSLCSWK